MQKVIVWDLDNTLYRETPEFHDLLDEITAKAAIEKAGGTVTVLEQKTK